MLLSRLFQTPQNIAIKIYFSVNFDVSTITWASQVVLVVKNLPAKAGDIRDMGSIPGSGRSPGGGHGNPLQYSCLENSMDRGAWQALSIGLQRIGHDTHTITLWGDTLNKIDESRAILGGVVVWDRVIMNCLHSPYLYRQLSRQLFKNFRIQLSAS